MSGAAATGAVAAAAGGAAGGGVICMDPNISPATAAGAGAGLTIVAAGARAGAGIANALCVRCGSGGFTAVGGVLPNASQPPLPPANPPFCACVGTTAVAEVGPVAPNTAESCDTAFAGAGVTNPPSPKGSANAGAGVGACGC